MPRLTSVKMRKKKEEKGNDDKSPAPAQQPEEVKGVQPLQAGKWLSWAIPSTVYIPKEEREMGMGLIPSVALLHPLGTLSPGLQAERQGLVSPQGTPPFVQELEIAV